MAGVDSKAHSDPKELETFLKKSMFAGILNIQNLAASHFNNIQSESKFQDAADEIKQAGH